MSIQKKQPPSSPCSVLLFNFKPGIFKIFDDPEESLVRLGGLRNCSVLMHIVHVSLLQLFDKFWYGLIKISNEASICHLEDRCIRVLWSSYIRHTVLEKLYKKHLALLIATMSLESFIPARC